MSKISVEVSIPCVMHIPASNADLFAPGILFESSEGTQLARVYLTEASRNQSFSRHFGFHYNRKQFELILEVAKQPAVRLAALAPRASRIPRCELFLSTGEPAGAIDVKLSAIRVPVRHDRATYRDHRGSEIGYVELRSSLTSPGCTLVDALRGWSYECTGPRANVIASPSAEVSTIDARLLLTFCYFVRFYLEEADE